LTPGKLNVKVTDIFTLFTIIIDYYWGLVLMYKQEQRLNELEQNNLPLDVQETAAATDPVSLSELPTEVRWRIGIESGLEVHDQWQLARSCNNFYTAMSHDLLKKKIYSYGVVPANMMDADIFTRYRPAYKVVHDVFNRAPYVFGEIHLDYKVEWPLVALMGLEFDALQEVLGDDPTRTDESGFNVLCFLAAGNHVELFKRCIKAYFPDFSNEDIRPFITAIVAGSEDVVRFLVDEYDFVLLPPDLKADSPESETTELHGILRTGMKSLFWMLVESGADLHDGLSFPVAAAKHKHWDVCDQLLARAKEFKIELSQEQKAALVCYAARDNHERFLKQLEECKDFDFSQFTIDDENVYTFACQGGQIKTVDFIVLKGWFAVAFPEDYRGKQGIHIAAQYGRKALIEHFLNTHDPHHHLRVCVDDDGKNIPDYAAMRGDWFNYRRIIDMAVFRHFLSNQRTPLISAITQKSHLNEAVKNGHLYFAQKFTREFGLEYLRGSEALREDAIASENPVMLCWVSEQLESFLKTEYSQVSNYVESPHI
jgi:hypothetical protein